MDKKKLINKMIKLNLANDEKQLKNVLNTQHIILLNKIYEARKKYILLDIKNFNKWLENQDFYDDGLSLQIIGYILGITRERVRQIEQNAIKKLKHPKLGRKLRDIKEKFEI